jgi:hypothetical protein
MLRGEGLVRLRSQMDVRLLKVPKVAAPTGRLADILDHVFNLSADFLRARRRVLSHASLLIA